MRILRPLLLVPLLVAVTAAVTVWLTGRSGLTPRPASAFQPTASIRELMTALVDPNADVVFESVGVISSAAGTTERAPATDDEWAAVERSALLLAEAGNLLRLPGRRVAGSPDDGGSGSGGDVLWPNEIRARIDADRARWDELASGLIDAGLQARQAARTRSVQGLYDVGGILDLACENCHRTFWYPDAVPYLPGGTRP